MYLARSAEICFHYYSKKKYKCNPLIATREIKGLIENDGFHFYVVGILRETTWATVLAEDLAQRLPLAYISTTAEVEA
jgi:hypothetical protein